ncbi:MAG: hypothetical protein NVSMB46_00970 [Candidatus Saccharimonadales bacterium]
MNGGKMPQGFTIVETLIFLAISGALLLTAMLLISGKQNQTEFTQAIHDTDSQLQDIITHVSRGYYASTSNLFTCQDNGTPLNPPTFSPGVNDRGSNSGCTFIGEVIQFSPNGDRTKYLVFPIVGKQFLKVSGGVRNTKDLTESVPRAIYPIAGVNAPDASQSFTFPYGLTVKKVSYDNGSGYVSVGSTGIFSSFVGYDTSFNLNSGAQSLDLIIPPSTTLNDSPYNTAVTISNMKNTNGGFSNVILNPSKGAYVCLQSGGTKQYGVINFGNTGGQISTKLTIYDKLSSVPANVCV